MLHHLLQAPVNSFEFQPCDRTPQAECLWRQLKQSKFFLNYSIHNLQYRLPGYLILFATYTFVPQCQFLPKSCLRYRYSFMLSTVITPKHKILLFCIKLKYSSIKSSSKVELQDFTINLQYNLRTLYAQLFRITLAPPVLPRLLARDQPGLLLLQIMSLSFLTKEFYNQIAVIIQVVLLNQTFVHCSIFLTAGKYNQPGPCLSSSVVDHPLKSTKDHRLGCVF